MVNLVVIDLGSNSVRMKITEIDEYGDQNVTDYRKEFVRLSEDMGPEKTLKKEPMKRTISALMDFKKIYGKLPNLVIKAVATAAVRQAKNQKDFIKMVQDQVGLKLEVISGAREAYLDYLGVTRTLPVKNGLIMDTGGASTEMILARDGQCSDRISIPIGSVTLSQNYHLTDKISAKNLFNAMTMTERTISAIGWLNSAHNLPLIALGGSNRTIAKVHRRRTDQDADDLPDIHGMHIPSQIIFRLMSELVSTDKEGRAVIPGLARSRSDVIVGGLLPIISVLRMLQINQVIFSNHGLRDGLIYSYLDARKNQTASGEN